MGILRAIVILGGRGEKRSEWAGFIAFRAHAGLVTTCDHAGILVVVSELRLKPLRNFGDLN